MVEKYNQDYIRNYLIHCIPENKDSNFSREEFKEKSDGIAGSLGNLLNRLNIFYAKYFDGKVGMSKKDGIVNLDMETVKKNVADLIQQYRIRDAFGVISHAIKEMNRSFANAQPWNTIKNDKE